MRVCVFKSFAFKFARRGISAGGKGPFLGHVGGDPTLMGAKGTVARLSCWHLAGDTRLTGGCVRVRGQEDFPGCWWPRGFPCRSLVLLGTRGSSAAPPPHRAAAESTGRGHRPQHPAATAGVRGAEHQAGIAGVLTVSGRQVISVDEQAQPRACPHPAIRIIVPLPTPGSHLEQEQLRPLPKVSREPVCDFTPGVAEGDEYC